MMYTFDIYQVEKLDGVRVYERNVGSTHSEDVESAFQYALIFAEALAKTPNIMYEIHSKFGVFKI